MEHIKFDKVQWDAQEAKKKAAKDEIKNSTGSNIKAKDLAEYLGLEHKA